MILQFCLLVLKGLQGFVCSVNPGSPFAISCGFTAIQLCTHRRICCLCTARSRRALASAILRILVQARLGLLQIECFFVLPLCQIHSILYGLQIEDCLLVCRNSFDHRCLLLKQPLAADVAFCKVQRKIGNNFRHRFLILLKTCVEDGKRALGMSSEWVWH